MSGAQVWRDTVQADIRRTARQLAAGAIVSSSPSLLSAWQVAELLHVDVEWVAARRQLLPCFDVPSDDGEPSLSRMRVRVEDLGVWKRATRQTR